jgi:MerR family transcriptional activator of bmr gene
MISIGKMAAYCQTSVQTLRLYDRDGLLVPAYVDPNSKYRYYQPEQIFQFSLIKYLQTTGFSLQEIRAILVNDKIDLRKFWQRQEKIIRSQLTEQYQRLALVQFQEKQAANLAIMKKHLDGRPYKRRITKTIATLPLQTKLGPADVPDECVACLNKQLLEDGQLPNLEYGFSFKWPQPAELNQIHYQTAFKELIEDRRQTSLHVQNVSGNYVCLDFMWSRERYLFFLKKLLKAAQQTGDVTVYEESFPLSYSNNDFAMGRRSLAELRIKV